MSKKISSSEIADLLAADLLEEDEVDDMIASFQKIKKKKSFDDEADASNIKKNKKLRQRRRDETNDWL